MRKFTDILPLEFPPLIDIYGSHAFLFKKKSSSQKLKNIIAVMASSHLNYINTLGDFYTI